MEKNEFVRVEDTDGQEFFVKKEKIDAFWWLNGDLEMRFSTGACWSVKDHEKKAYERLKRIMELS